MYKEIKLYTQDGEKTFGFLATGSTAIRYRQVFHQDLMVLLNKLQKIDETDDVDTGIVDKLAFIMNAQAEKKDMNTLSSDDFINWVDQFDGAELFKNMDKIVGLYLGNKFSGSSQKKGAARQSGK
ncbi:MAG: hypothetical protein DUD30_00665 [Lactobacillus sp.]|nr:MAG: hypothetical protein DUD30_00665 [Lactobacillus sp.]